MAQNRNHTLVSEQIQYQIKEKDEDRAFAGYLPTVKANVGYRGVDSDNSIFVDEVSTANGYLSSYNRSLDGSWELFSSGGTMARVSQAKHNARAELFNVERVRRDIISNTRQAYRNIISSINQIQALEQAVVSGISALEATKSGYDVGTKVSTDVLNRLSDLYRQKQDLAIAKYLYIKNVIKIKNIRWDPNQWRRSNY
jgi:outer membrane protein